MAKPLDLDAYLGRIDYTGPRTPTYDALTGILQAHIASIPFESFDVLLGRPIRLDPEGLQAKIVTGRRGGYCFEHASLMYAALEAIGFAPAGPVRAVGMVEMPMAAIAGRRMFAERLTAWQWAAGVATALGVVLAALG